MTRHLHRFFKACAAGCIGAAALLGASAARAQTAPSTTAPAPDDAPYKNPALPFEQRVADLVGRMTLLEKAQQVQWQVPRNARLGIPAVNWWTEAIHGVSRAGTATVFPQAMAMAAAWDPPMMQKVGDTIADEARAKYDPAGQRYRGIMVWAPTINMARDPRWGRTEETYGEDPYLTGRLAVSFIKGLQGDDPKYLKTVATPKHFAVHSQETQRMNRSFDVSDAVLHDYYLPAFRDAVMEGKATSVMTAFSGFNKIPATANFWLLTDLLRRNWGFEGAVVTDWGAVTHLYDAHHYVDSLPAAVTAALNAGVDVISDPQEVQMANYIVQAVNGKQLKEDVLNRALTRNLMLRFRLGMFDPPAMVPFARMPASTVGSKDHIALALKAAQESFVLLKNDEAPRGYGLTRLLPLDLRRIDSIAVLGPYANTRQLGAYSGVPAAASPTILEALRAAVGDRIVIRTDPANNIEDTSIAAAKSDVVIFVCGLNGNIEKEGADRGSLQLPADQQNLLERVVKANPMTIVLLEGGSCIGLDWMKRNVPAIMMVWYPGEQGGIAAAQALLGQVNPAGRLPLTFYRANDDLPPLDDYDITRGRTYQYYNNPQKAPSFVFGHGLSYTSFDYRTLKVAPAAAADGTITVTLDVANTGSLDGDEVVQVYVSEKDPPPDLKRPLRQLKAFQRVAIARGQTRTVTLGIPAETLGFWDTASKKYVVDKTTYEIQVGASSADIRARAEVVIK